MIVSPTFENAQKLYEEGSPQLLSTRIIADLDTPVSLFSKVAQGQKNSFILESVTGGEARARFSILGLNPDLVFRAKDDKCEINTKALFDDRFLPLKGKPIDELKKLIDNNRIENFDTNLPAPASGLFGYMSYDVIRQIEPLGAPNFDPIQTPDMLFFRPTIIVIVDNVKHEVIIVTPLHPRDDMAFSAAYEIASERLRNALDKIQGSMPAAIPLRAEADVDDLSANMSKPEFLEMVRRAKEYILAGDIFQVVLSQRWTLPFSLPPFALYRALRRTNPSPYMFFFEFGDFQVIGASPEILVNLTGETVTIRPIAGTRPRGENPQEDMRLEKELLADPKECAEHLMLIDLGRNDVGRVSQPKTVKPTEQFIVERYSHVMHIVSNVIGKLARDKSAIDALLSGLPAGTLSGAPKVRAMQIIDELEPEKRGVYGGGVGYFSANGDMDICIALRTAILANKKLYIQAGAGIVYDSDPESEYQECEHKSRALLVAAKEAVYFADSTN